MVGVAYKVLRMEKVLLQNDEKNYTHILLKVNMLNSLLDALLSHNINIFPNLYSLSQVVRFFVSDK